MSGDPTGSDDPAPGLMSVLAEIASPVGMTPFVVRDLASIDDSQRAELAGLHSAVRIGVDRGGLLPDDVASCFDLLLTSHAVPPREWVSIARSRIDVVTAQIAERVALRPHAAGVLCQVLRLGERLRREDALILESLAYSTLLGGGEFVRWRAAMPPVERSVHHGVSVRVVRCGDSLDIIIDRPDTRNAMSATVRDELVEAMRTATLDCSIADVRLTGAGRAFLTGGDLAEFGRASDLALAHAVRVAHSVAREIFALGDRIEVIAHGACIGSGVEVMAAARRVSARSGAFFHLPELIMGLIPGAGGTVTVSRRIGRWRTCWMVLSGRRIGLAQALRWGLADRLRP